MKVLRAIRKSEKKVLTSYKEIADVLNAEGIPTKHNGVWAQQTVKNILTAAER
jgi:hypothetical protein